MMLCPEAYVESLRYEKKSYKKLLEERKLLLDAMIEYKKEVYENGKKSLSNNIYPAPESRYQMQLNYLIQLLNYMNEVFEAEKISDFD